MNKETFLNRLRAGLSGLPGEEIERYVTDYSENIDDRMEEGMGEEAAVAALGNLEEILNQAKNDASDRTAAGKKREKRERLPVWAIVLLILGAPVWLSLFLALGAVVLSVLAVFWSVVIGLFAADLGLAVSGIACLAISGLFLLRGEAAAFMLAFGAGLVCAGLAILLFFVGNIVARGVGFVTGWCVRILWRGLTGRGKKS